MKPLLILGPTASGKTALALALAARIDGEIVNADAMQCYRDLRVLTARPSPDEEAQAPHHVFGFVDAAQRFSVGDWLRAAVPVIEAIAARGRTPIVVGGTGLAFLALTRGLVETPPIPDEIRAALAADLARDGAPALHARLAGADPESAARLSPNDAPRIVRALEVLEAFGAPLHALHSATAPALADWAGVALTPDRETLYARIEARFDAMLREGALEEARALAARGLDPALPLMKAHGMPWLAAYLRGEMPLDEAAALGKRDTRRYAKRQFTWIAHQATDWPRLTETDLTMRIGAVLRQLGD